MDAFGYRLEDDGSIMFSWVIVNSYGQTLCLKGLLGEVQHQFMDLGANYTVDNFETQTVPML